MKKELYFIAIIPSSPAFDQALELKNYFKEKYKSKAALNSPPHITLHMPFEWRAEKEEKLITSLENFASRFPEFDLTLQNFSCFEPRVIFIDVVKNSILENLQQSLHRFCKQELNLFNANYREHPFHPHLTLAFRDLRKSEFVKAWEEFRERKFDATWTVKAIVLLKHDGKIWNTIRHCSMESFGG